MTGARADGIDLDAIAAHLKSAPWMDEEWRAARFEIDDLVPLGQKPGRFWFLIMRPEEGAEPQCFVPLVSDGLGAFADATRTADYDKLIVLLMRDRPTLATLRGGMLEFRGAPAPFCCQLPFDPEWSSNSLSLIDLGGVPHIHKTYRRLSLASNEPWLLRMLDGEGLTPDYVGDYAYIDAVSGERWPLGVVYRYAEGDGLDVPLRQNLRSLWPRTMPSGNASSAVDEHLRPLEGLLHAVGRFVRDFHDVLSARLGAATEFSLAPYLAGLSGQLAALAPKIMADHELSVEVRQLAVESMRQVLESVRKDLDWRLPLAGVGGPCHGDLHLAHILLRADSQGAWDLRVIDPSLPCIDTRSPQFANQSPWQDLAALRRAIEHFAAEEAAYESSQVLGGEQERLCHDVLLAAAGARPPSPHTQTLLGIHSTAAAWSSRVARLILEGYGWRHPAQDMAELETMFYLGRLLHELSYNYARNRPYHAAMDLRHALALASRVPPSPYPTNAPKDCPLCT